MVGGHWMNAANGTNGFETLSRAENAARLSVD